MCNRCVLLRGARQRPHVFAVHSRVHAGMRETQDRLDEFRRVLAADVEGSRKEPACIRMDLLRDEFEHTRYYFYMAYRDQSGLEEHRCGSCVSHDSASTSHMDG